MNSVSSQVPQQNQLKRSIIGMVFSLLPVGAGIGGISVASAVLSKAPVAKANFNNNYLEGFQEGHADYKYSEFSECPHLSTEYLEDRRLLDQSLDVKLEKTDQDCKTAFWQKAFSGEICVTVSSKAVGEIEPLPVLSFSNTWGDSFTEINLMKNGDNTWQINSYSNNQVWLPPFSFEANDSLCATFFTEQRTLTVKKPDGALLLTTIFSKQMGLEGDLKISLVCETPTGIQSLKGECTFSEIDRIHKGSEEPDVSNNIIAYSLLALSILSALGGAHFLYLFSKRAYLQCNQGQSNNWVAARSSVSVPARPAATRSVVEMPSTSSQASRPSTVLQGAREASTTNRDQIVAANEITDEDYDHYGDTLFDEGHTHLCPILFQVMRDPVIASDGRNYERRAILQILHDGRVQNGQVRSPFTNQPLEANVYDNLALRDEIAAAVKAFKQQNANNAVAHSTIEPSTAIERARAVNAANRQQALNEMPEDPTERV